MRTFTIELRVNGELDDKRLATLKMLVLRAARGLRDTTQPSEICVYSEDFFLGQKELNL